MVKMVGFDYFFDRLASQSRHIQAQDVFGLMVMSHKSVSKCGERTALYAVREIVLNNEAYFNRLNDVVAISLENSRFYDPVHEIVGSIKKNGEGKVTYDLEGLGLGNAFTLKGVMTLYLGIEAVLTKGCMMARESAAILRSREESAFYAALARAHENRCQSYCILNRNFYGVIQSKLLGSVNNSRSARRKSLRDIILAPNLRKAWDGFSVAELSFLRAYYASINDSVF
ncbi:hypothetical protein HYU11_05810 [Candidatus Woesearchaeota archaeon]|nr:hypothetical protein [Candidatus Woesearchaeota archaeon]